ncbi:MaoC family dehydratase [Variovorax ginsengisoli]|uniref:MaoC family dehydratase n=1 Tax=Variovorax ginsengisoli TaxID=363844 RepID=A0ABT8S7N0_9BURK|nr:MaoC family dehydratase [Variovorax ginsengisoli]MDN8615645.1 MaoC family dehydratase [Variovorax ginsengisoli]MDO1534815.1 MaoC family dehydratase [Variovorax ginsengisoli]
MTIHKHHSNFFEDFRIGQVIRHATPRTVTDGDSATYMALTGSRFASHSADSVAQGIGYAGRPLDDLLVFNIAFGKTVPEISLNAVANLGYAELRFLSPVFAGDTLSCESVVIGLKENSNRRTGVVYVRSTCHNGDGIVVLTWVRWVMVYKRKAEAEVAESHVPELASATPLDDLVIPARVHTKEALEAWCEATGSRRLWEEYAPGDRIDHPLGMTIEEADHMSATRLYQNNSRPHFDELQMRSSPVGRRLVYGGHVISICRALAYDGLENVLSILSIDGGTHVAPCVAGDTLYAYSEVLDRRTATSRSDVGVLRLRLVGLKNTPPIEVPALKVEGKTRGSNYHPAVVLDLDYSVAVPRNHFNGTRHA